MWERAPPAGSAAKGGTLAGGISKELLRKVCEPYFDQMLETLLMVLQHPYGVVEEEEAFGCLNPTSGSHSHMDHLSEDQNIEECESDLGAFSSVLVSPPPGTWQDAQGQEIAPPKIKCTPAGAGPTGLSLSNALEQDKPQVVMVCRHWKSKGWCRLGDDCKFSHPEHKCGVGAPSASKGASQAHVGNGHSSDDDATLGADGSKKPGRKRRSKRGSGQKASQQPAGQGDHVVAAVNNPNPVQ